MRLRKVLSAILCIAMVLSSFSFTAIADGTEGVVAKIGDTEYASLEYAIANSIESDKIMLLADAEIVTGSTEGIGALADHSITIDGQGEYKLTATGAGVSAIGVTNGTLTLNDLTLVDESVSHNESSWEFGYLELGGNLELNNVTAADPVMFENATATVYNSSFEGKTTEFSQYGAWVQGGNVTFVACTFTGTRAIKACDLYGDTVEAITVDSCEFDTITEKPGIALDISSGEVTVENNTFIDTTPFSTEYEIDVNFASNTVDGEDWEPYVAEIDGKNFMDLEKAFAYAKENNNSTITLLSDVELNNWTAQNMDAVGFTLDGNNKTITGLTTALIDSMTTGGHTVVIKDLTIDGATNEGIQSSHSGNVNAGGLVNVVGYKNITLSNVNVINSTIGGASTYYAGGLIGYVAATEDSILNVENCSVSDTTITGASSVGGLFGHSNGGLTTVTETTVGGNTLEGGSPEKEGVLVGTLTACKGTKIDATETALSTGSGETLNVTGRAYTEVTYTGGSYYTDPTVASATNENTAINIAPDFVIKANDEGKFTVVEKYAAAIDGVKYKTLAEAIAAAEGETTINVVAGTHTMPNSVAGKNITLVGSGKDTVIEMLTAVGASNSTINFESLTAKFDNDSYEGLQHATKVTYTDCTHIGTEFLYATDVAYTDCTFEMYDAATEYAVWTYGAANVDFTDCVFNTNGKAVLVYNEGAVTAEIAVDKCEFNSNGTYTGKAAIEIGQSANGAKATYDVVIKDSTADENFSANNSNSNLWGNKDGMDLAEGSSDGIGVVVDGEAWGGYCATIGENRYNTLEEALKAVKKDETIILTKDYAITGTGNPWNVYELPENAILDLNGKTLQIQFGQALFAGKNITIKNGTVTPLDGSQADYALYLGSTTGNSQTVTIETSVTLEDIVSPRSGINALWESDVTLKNCEVTVDPARTKSYAVATNNRASVTIESGSYTGSATYKYDISKGTYATVTIYGGTFSQEIDETYLAEGYFATIDATGNYVVEKGTPVAEVNSKQYMTLAEAIDAAPAFYTIKVLRDFSESGITVDADQSVTIDLNGYTITGDFYSEGKAVIKNGEIINTACVSGIESNGTNADLTVEDLTITSNRHALRIDGGKAHIISGTYTSNTSEADATSAYAVNVGGDIATELVIDGGEFTASEYALTQGTALMLKNSLVTTTINGGTFNSGDIYSLENYGTLTINGGTFDEGFVANDSTVINAGTFGMRTNPAPYVAEGKEATLVNSLYTINPARKYIIEASKSEVVAGETFTVTVSLDGTALYGAEWELVYDETLFKTDDETSGISYGTLITKDVPVATYTFEALPKLEETEYYTFTLVDGAIAQTNSEAAESIEPVPEVVTDEAKVKILLKDFEYDVSVDNASVNDAASVNMDFDGAEHTVAITSVPDTAEIEVTVNGKGADVDALKFTATGEYVINYTITQIGYAPVTGTFTFTIDTPKYVVELNHDYVANDNGAKTLVLVYTDSDDISFNYDGAPVFDVTYKGYKYDDGSDEGVAYAKVYAIAVDYADADEAKVKVDYKEADAKYLLTLPNPEYDLTRDGRISISDVTSAYAVYNADPDFFINFMKHVLTADVVADKKVNGGDTGAYVKAYTDNRNK